MKLRTAWLAVAALASAGPARAEWLRASSRHFTIYSDTGPEAITTLATRLERVDAALRLISSATDDADAAANPVTVYVLDGAAAIQKLAKRGGIGGFYLPRAGGAVAFTPRRGAGDGLDPQIVLFHEYAHHFLLSNSRVAYPAWLSEGYAEFVSTAGIDDANTTIGRAAQHRAGWLWATKDAPLAPLLAPTAKATREERDQVYPRGWLLTHYLLTDPGGTAKLRAYLLAINAGTPPLQAATESFGDLKELGRALERHLSKRTLRAFVISNARLPVAAPVVRPLTPGERALIEDRMVSERGVDDKEAAAVYARASKAAAPFPNDAAAQGWLAEMAHDAGRDGEAEAAADRALAADPRSVQALLYKGRVRLRRAAKAADPKAWAEARSWIVKANRVDTNAAAPLLLFYDSFAMAGEKPRPAAVAGLHRAFQLAPQDPSLRFKSARQHLLDGEVDAAKQALRPLAYSPHAPAGNPAARLLALVEAGGAGPAALDEWEREQKAAAKAEEPAAR